MSAFRQLHAVTPSKLHLYSGTLCGCSAQVRIAALLKGISLNEHRHEQGGLPNQYYRESKPAVTIPTLLAEYPDGASLTITQPLSMLEFLEESYPDSYPLLPPVEAIRERMWVKDLAALVTGSMRISSHAQVKDRLPNLGGDIALWGHDVIEREIRIFNDLASRCTGRFSVGNSISLADVCLYPLVQGANRAGMVVGLMRGKGSIGAPTVMRIMLELSQIDAFSSGGLQRN